MLGKGIEAFDKIINDNFYTELSSLNSSKEFYQFFLASEKDVSLTKSVISDIKNKGINGYCTIVGLYFYFKYKDVELLQFKDHVFMKYKNKYFDAYDTDGVSNIKDLYYFKSRNINNPKIYKYNTSRISKEMWKIASKMKLSAVNDRSIECTNNKIPNIIQNIYNKLINIKYGAYNTKTKKYINDVDQDDFEYVKLQTPIETMKSGYGTCYEQAILTAYLAKQYKLQYSCGMFANIIGNTHLICCVNYEKSWYWIEHAWGNYRKIHGPFSSLKDIDKLVSKLLVDSNKSKITYNQFDFPVEQFFSGNHMYPDIIKVANSL